MRPDISLKQTWILLVLITAIVPTTSLMIWFGSQLYTNRLNSALKIEQQKNEAFRDQFLFEIKRLKTVFHNKTNPLIPLIKNIGEPNTLKKINRYLSIMIGQERAVREIIILSKEVKIISAIKSNIGLSINHSLSEEENQGIKDHWGFNRRYKPPEIVIPMLGRDYISSPQEHDGFMTFHIAVPIGNPTVGVMVAVIDINRLWNYNDKIRQKVEGHLQQNYIIDRRGILITITGDSMYQQGDLVTQFDIVRRALINQPWPIGKSYVGVDAQNVYGTTTSIPLLNWSLISEVAVSRIIDPIKKDLLKIFIYINLGLGLLIWIILLLVTITLKPIQELCKATQKIAGGDYQISLKKCGIQELDVLVEDFNLMAKRQKNSKKLLEFSVIRAENANKERTDFFTSMSHDLRTPLNAIIGLSELMKLSFHGPLGSDKNVEYVNDINKSGQYLLQLVNNILDISKLEAGERSIVRQLIDVKEIFLDCYKLLYRLAEDKKITCNLETTKDLPMIYADKHALMQILMNVFANAIKFTPEGGYVTCNTKVLNGKHIIEISDSGIGIAEGKLKSITKPFVRVEENPYLSKQEGTGLGLAIVKLLVDLHDGVLEIKSILGKGTTVTISLPPEANS